MDLLVTYIDLELNDRNDAHVLELYIFGTMATMLGPATLLGANHNIGF